MGIFKDLTGQKFARLTVIQLAQTKPTKWKCLCECGNTTIVTTDRLTSGKTRSCGCLYKESRTARTADIQGQKFGRLTVIRRVHKGNKNLWECRCDCGNITYSSTVRLQSGITQSCGCLAKERASQANLIDLTGKTFQSLTVVKLTQHRPVKWECVCECGKTIIVPTARLTSGAVTSCGCKTIKKINPRIIDRSGQKFGHLLAIEPVFLGDGVTRYRCLCDCGKEKIVRAGGLANGTTKSCGCRTGQTRYSAGSFARCGLEMEIIAHRNNTDIDIRFEDGVVVKHKSYGDYRNGYIRHPNLQPKQNYHGFTICYKAYQMEQDVYYFVIRPDGRKDIMTPRQMYDSKKGTSPS